MNLDVVLSVERQHPVVNRSIRVGPEAHHPQSTRPGLKEVVDAGEAPVASRTRVLQFVVLDPRHRPAEAERIRSSLPGHVIRKLNRIDQIVPRIATIGHGGSSP